MLRSPARARLVKSTWAVMSWAPTARSVTLCMSQPGGRATGQAMCNASLYDFGLLMKDWIETGARSALLIAGTGP